MKHEQNKLKNNIATAVKEVLATSLFFITVVALFVLGLIISTHFA